MPVVESRGARIYFKVTGPANGVPLVLVMGLGWDMSAWDPMMQYVEDFRVLRIDNRGVGRSDAPDAAYSIPMMAADVVACMDAAGIESAHVYGASMGSMIAQELALSHPRRVRSLILGCPSPGVISFPGSPGILALLLQRHRLTDEEAFRRAAPYLFGTSLSNPALLKEALKVRMARRTNPTGFRRQLQATLRWSSLSRLHRLRIPTLIIHGDRDRLLPIANGRLLARLIPGARFHALRGAGHVYSVDAPDEARRVVMAFLQEQVGLARAS